MKALILAAGEGTRLRALTRNRPKPMLPLQDSPLLHRTIEWLHDAGIRQIAINLHHRPEKIVGYFGDGSEFGVELTYSYETSLMGTAGAAKRLANFLDESFFVVYGDVYTNVSLRRIVQHHSGEQLEAGSGNGVPSGPKRLMTLVLYDAPNPLTCGLVEVDYRGRVTRFVEKPRPDQVFTNQAFSGLAMCEPELLEYVPYEQPYDFGHDLFPRLLGSGAPIYVETLASGEFVIDIGTLEGYFRALKQAGENGQMSLALTPSGADSG